MPASYQLRTRSRMYLLVTLLCGAAAAGLQLFLAGTGEFRNYAERHLDSTVRAAVHQEVTDLSETETQR
ncbi:MAG: hypothetical protein O2782_20660 [bacterium]|nr:hypothetical protein [bacterium]